jgi:hypothetical protein
LYVHEIGDENSPKSARSKRELLIGQADSLLIVGSSMQTVEKVVVRLTGGAAPSLGEQAGFEASYQALFRDATFYAWINAKVLMDSFSRRLAQRKEGPPAVNPFEALPMDKLFNASGLPSLKTISLTVQDSNDGLQFRVSLGVPESTRQGLFKILCGEAKESTVPPFVPVDAVKFRRWRLDGQKAWIALWKMLEAVSPRAEGTADFLFDTAGAMEKEKDPGFNLKKMFLANLGDDFIIYEKAPRGLAPANLKAPPSILLVGSPNPGQLAAALKMLLVILPRGDSAIEREFLGHKIYSVPMPRLMIPVPGVTTSAGQTATLHYTAGGGYLGLSTDPSLVEEFLRSAESPGKPLREVPGLAEAAQKVIGPGTDMFGYQNRQETLRTIVEALRKDPTAANAGGLDPLPFGALPGLTEPRQALLQWMDFSFLPPFDQVAKYFGFTVCGGSANADGLSYKFFVPTPAKPKP